MVAASGTRSSDSRTRPHQHHALVSCFPFFPFFFFIRGQRYSGVKAYTALRLARASECAAHDRSERFRRRLSPGCRAGRRSGWRLTRSSSASPASEIACARIGHHDRCFGDAAYWCRFGCSRMKTAEGIRPQGNCAQDRKMAREGRASSAWFRPWAPSMRVHLRSRGGGERSETRVVSNSLSIRSSRPHEDFQRYPRKISKGTARESAAQNATDLILFRIARKFTRRLCTKYDRRPRVWSRIRFKSALLCRCCGQWSPNSSLPW